MSAVAIMIGLVSLLFISFFSYVSIPKEKDNLHIRIILLGVFWFLAMTVFVVASAFSNSSIRWDTIRGVLDLWVIVMGIATLIAFFYSVWYNFDYALIWLGVK